MNAATVSLVCAGVLAMLGPACRRVDDSGPPELRVGRDECRECGMLVSEDRCAAAAIVASPASRSTVVFDDIGCLIDYQIALDAGKGEAGERIESWWVRDYNARTWLAPQQAVLLAADKEKIRTPMGTGIMAAGSREDAEALRAALGGVLTTFEELVKARRR